MRDEFFEPKATTHCGMTTSYGNWFDIAQARELRDFLNGVLPPDPDETTITDLCEDCNERPITGLDALCDGCRENANERAYDRSMEEPTYRGSEYASALAEQQAQAKRLK